MLTTHHLLRNHQLKLKSQLLRQTSLSRKVPVRLFQRSLQLLIPLWAWCPQIWLFHRVVAQRNGHRFSRRSNRPSSQASYEKLSYLRITKLQIMKTALFRGFSSITYWQQWWQPKSTWTRSKRTISSRKLPPFSHLFSTRVRVILSTMMTTW